MAQTRRHIRPPKRAKKPKPGPSPLLFFIWSFCLVSAAIFYLWIYNQNRIFAARNMALHSYVIEMVNTNRELQGSIERLSRIDRITEIARTRLNMHVPAAESLVVFIGEVDR